MQYSCYDLLRRRWLKTIYSDLFNFFFLFFLHEIINTIIYDYVFNRPTQRISPLRTRSFFTHSVVFSSSCIYILLVYWLLRLSIVTNYFFPLPKPYSLNITFIFKTTILNFRMTSYFTFHMQVKSYLIGVDSFINNSFDIILNLHNILDFGFPF